MEKLCPAVFGIFTLLLLLAGAFSPGWFIIDVDNLSGLAGHELATNVKVHLGLFYLLVVGDDFTEVVGYSSDLKGTSLFALGYLEYQVEVCIGLSLAFISLIMVWVYNRDRSPSMLLGPIIMFIIAAISTWVAVGRWLSGVILLATYIKVTVPYSLILSGLGGIFCIILMIILIVMYSQHNKDRNPAQAGVIFSDVAMGNYPQTQPYGQQYGQQYGDPQGKQNLEYNYNGPPPKA